MRHLTSAAPRQMSRRLKLWRFPIVVILVGSLVASLFAEPGTPGTSAQAATFLEAFTGNPAAPAPWRPGNWDVQKHSRDLDTWAAPEPLEAQHGADCGAPPATHHVAGWDDVVFLCRDHLMTGLNADGYGAIYLTPPALVDFSAGPGVVQWEMSTQRLSTRDWVDVLISPWQDNVARPLRSDLSDGVDLQGPPRNAIHVGTDDGENAPLLSTVRDGAVSRYNTGGTTPPLGEGVVAGTNQAASRQTFRLTVSRSSARFERLASASAPALLFWSYAIPDTGWSRGVVQFGHHSYNPTKDGAGVPATWHWDNVSITPAVPFTILPGGVHLIQSEAQAVTFPRPAPANALLRFAATSGQDVQVSVDGGPWAVARRSTQPVGDRFKAVSYWTPVPQGATSVRFRGTGGYWGGAWRVEDPHLWAPGPAAPP